MPEPVTPLAAAPITLDRVLRFDAVAAALGLSVATLYRRLNDDPSFPKPIATGRNSRGFLASEVAAWLAARKAARDAGTDPHLNFTPAGIGKGRPRKSNRENAA
jgi:prophage regulatory protein